MLASLALITGSDGQDARLRKVDIFVFDQAYKLVRQNFVDRKKSGAFWSRTYSSYRKKAAKAKSQAELHQIILDMLGQLKVSHLTLVEDDVFEEHILAELRNRTVPTFGVDLVKRPEGLFVAALADGGSGLLGGLRRGDRLVAINNQAPMQSPALRPAGSDPGLGGNKGFHLSPKNPLSLTIERRPAKDNKGIFTRTFRASNWNLVQASIASIRVEKKFTHTFGYIHMWHLGHSRIVDALNYAMCGPFRACDGLILDLRGRGGTPANVDHTLNLFNPKAPYGPRWTKPVVAIIDAGTRSAKEVLAFHLKCQKWACLVGEKTQGAVLGAKFFSLRDGSHLMLPTVDMRALTFGISLEGRGVSPHVTVKDHIPWAEGKDPLLEKARAQLFWMIRKQRQKYYRRGWY
jgi:carboxyl-terminal processing protease